MTLWQMRNYKCLSHCYHVYRINRNLASLPRTYRKKSAGNKIAHHFLKMTSYSLGPNKKGLDPKTLRFEFCMWWTSVNIFLCLILFWILHTGIIWWSKGLVIKWPFSGLRVFQRKQYWQFRAEWTIISWRFRSCMFRWILQPWRYTIKQSITLFIFIELSNSTFKSL